MDIFLQVFYILFSSVLFSLAIPNEFLYFGSPLCGMVALIPFYIAISRCRTFRGAILLTMLQSLLVHLLSSFWLAFFKGFAFLTLGSSAIGTSCLSALFGGLYFLPWAWQTGRSQLLEYSGVDIRRIPFRIFWFPVVVVLWEWTKSCGFLGYPWGTLSSTVFRWHILMQIADITGTYGVTFLLALFASVCGEGILLAGGLPRSETARPAVRAYRNSAAVWTVLFTAAFIYGCCRWAEPRTAEKRLNAVIVQQNYDPWSAADDTPTILDSERLSEEQIEQFRRNGIEPDIVVWSEGVLTHPFPDGALYYSQFPVANPLIPFIQRQNIPFIIGGSYAVSREHHQYTNSVLLFDKTGEYRGYYGKLHLVPFAEVIPGVENPAIYHFVMKIFGFPGWYHGEQYTYFDIPGHYDEHRPKPAVNVISLAQTRQEQTAAEQERPLVRISTPICYDDAFPEVCTPLFRNGSDVFINLTDDSWSKRKSAEYQHFIVASYRAIECRTTLVRSTNAGYSVVLDPAGRILADMPLFTRSAAAVSIPVYRHTMTPYVLFGNWLPGICLVIAGCASCLYLVSARARHDAPSERKWNKKKKKHSKGK